MRRYAPLISALRFEDGSHTWLSVSWRPWTFWRVSTVEWFRALHRATPHNGVAETVSLDISTGHVETVWLWTFVLRWLRGEVRRLP